jgi:hypothetical protein
VQTGALLFLLGFLRVVLEKVRAERGFLVVKRWSMCGESWWVDGRFSETKNMPLFLTIFSIFSTERD